MGGLDASIPFPPPPRSWPGLLDQVLGRLDGDARLPWQPVFLPGLRRPWVGVQGPALRVPRAWQWDVVVPDDVERERGLAADPLVLAVEQDLVVVDLRRDDDPSFQLRMQVDVRRSPDRIEVPAAAIPDPPWRLELATGWSVGAIASALRTWALQRTGRAVRVEPDGEDEAPSISPDRYALADELFVTGSAMDTLLALGPDAAAVATAALGATADALSPWR